MKNRVKKNAARRRRKSGLSVGDFVYERHVFGELEWTIRGIDGNRRMSLRRWSHVRDKFVYAWSRV